ncbi:MAG: hypothetical protein R3B13_40390 [Polyangiaceae bacterium]
MLDGGEQHATSSTCRVVDGFAFLRVEDIGHQAHDAARGVELAGLLVGSVSELLDQVLVGIAYDVVAHGLVAEGQRREVLDEILQQVVGQPILVRPLRVTEDAVQVLLVGGLDPAHRVLQLLADVRGGLADIAPVAALGHLEPVLVFEVLAVRLDRLGVLLVPDVADALEEEERQDVALPVGAIDGAAAEDVRGLPKVGFELLERQLERQ